MARPDVRLLRVLADEVSLDVLLWLLGGPATQKEIVAALGMNSGTVSKRMAMLEDIGLVFRARSHAPYEVVEPVRTRALIEAASDLASDLAEADAVAARERAREVRKAGFAGGRLPNRATERP